MIFSHASIEHIIQYLLERLARSVEYLAMLKLCQTTQLDYNNIQILMFKHVEHIPL